jgi:hypothetical protein
LISHLKQIEPDLTDALCPAGCLSKDSWETVRWLLRGSQRTERSDYCSPAVVHGAEKAQLVDALQPWAG